MQRGSYNTILKRKKEISTLALCVLIYEFINIGLAQIKGNHYLFPGTPKSSRTTACFC